MRESLRVLLVSGSLRAGSTNTAVLRTARELAGENVETSLYGGMGTLPHFNPDDDREGQPVHTAVAQLRSEAQCQGASSVDQDLFLGRIAGQIEPSFPT